MKKVETFPVLQITNPNKRWVSAELDKLIEKWKSWNDFCLQLEDSPDYNPQTCTEAIKDGRDNIRKHELLREKTLVFIRNHFSGSEFVLKSWPTHPYENVCSRLRTKVPVWIHRLDMLKASMDYVLVPDGFWKIQGKSLIESLSKSTGDKAVDIAAAYLQNPLG